MIAKDDLLASVNRFIKEYEETATAHHVIARWFNEVGELTDPDRCPFCYKRKCEPGCRFSTATQAEINAHRLKRIRDDYYKE